MRLLLVVLVGALALPAGSAGAATFVPPRGKVYTGLSGSTSASPFTEQVGSDVAVFGVFTKWYGHNEYAFDAARSAGARLMLQRLDAGRLRHARADHAARDRPRRR